MNRICVSALALLVLAGAAHAQVDFRFRTRLASNPTSGNTTPNPASISAVGSVLDIAVQAKGLGTGVAGYDFDIAIVNALGATQLLDVGESESRGTLQLSRINDRFTGGQYVPNNATWQTTNPGSQYTLGLAQQYTYLAGLNSAFNGQINSSSGTFVNDPNTQEIGLIAGSSREGALFGTPGVDPDGKSAPATWSHYNDRDANDNFTFTPNPGDTAPLDSAPGSAFFGKDNYVDIFHFKYTVTSNSVRDLIFEIRNAHAQTFNQFIYTAASPPVWTADATAALNVTTQNLTIHVTPTPSTMALLGLGGLVAARRRRA